MPRIPISNLSGLGYLFSLAILVCEPQCLATTPQKSSETLQETIRPGSSFIVNTNLNLKGRKSDATEAATKSTPILISAGGSTRYHERVVQVAGPGEGPGAGHLSLRRYASASLEKTIAGEKQQLVLRPQVARIVASRLDQHTTVFSPDGPLTAGELEMIQADTYCASLTGLLPGRIVKNGDQWNASDEVASELTGIGPIESGSMNCTMVSQGRVDQHNVARIKLSGTLFGPSDQGAQRQTVEGYFLFDLDQRHLSQLVLSATSVLLDSDGKAAGQLEGRFELTRRRTDSDAKLGELANKAESLKATPASTSLLFDSSELGARFLYPRNWEVQSVVKNVVRLQEPTGGNLRVTLNQQSQPDAAKLRDELLDWLAKKKATVTSADNVEPLQLAGPRVAKTFRIRADVSDAPGGLANQSYQWVYVVFSDGDKSAVLSASLTDDRADALATDMESMARSIQFTARSGGSPRKTGD